MRKLFIISTLVIVSCIINTSAANKNAIKKGLSVICESDAQATIGFLASDALQGREAGTNTGKIAAEYLKSEFIKLGIKPFYDTSYFQHFNAYSKERAKRVRYSVQKDSIAKYKACGTFREIHLQNVLGAIIGKNKDEYVVIGAHYDHLGMDINLSGDQIYNGADDNASGVSAVLQIARAFIASGQQPERTIIFALWDGEEENTLGSQYFVQHLASEQQKVKGYVNFDMIGRNHYESNPEYVVYFYTKSHPIFGEWLKDDINKYKLQLKPDYRAWEKPIGGSDNSSFAIVNIPVIWYHTDWHPDYHQPGDEISKINWKKVVEITKAAFLNGWNLANLKTY